MQTAAFLSDLKTLSVCSPEAAMALVRPPAAADSSNEEDAERPSQPADVGSRPVPRQTSLQRAAELVSLHYDVKVRYLQTGPDRELVRAARDVDRVLDALGRS